MVSSRAAVKRDPHGPLVIEEIRVEQPREGEVLVRLLAVGICGSDAIHVHNDVVPLPSVCGHEGAGVVESVGQGVRRVRPGDLVVQSFVPACGTCRNCRLGRTTFCRNADRATDGRYPDGGFRMFGQGGEGIATPLRLGSFSHWTVTMEANCVVVPQNTDPSIAALLACGAMTGAGAAINVAEVRQGSRVVVIGLGGVGTAALLGAVVAGASQIVCVDRLAARSQTTLSLGATAFIWSEEPGAAEHIRAALDDGEADAVLLTLAAPRDEQISLGVDLLAAGGRLVLVGVPPPEVVKLPISPHALIWKQAAVVGTLYGTMNHQRDVERLLGLHRAGRFPIDRLITNTYALEDINHAFDDLATGRNIRGIVRY